MPQLYYSEKVFPQFISDFSVYDKELLMVKGNDEEGIFISSYLN